MKHFERLTADDVLTPANGITALGLFLVLAGSFYLYKPAGLALVIVGRALDLVDGPVARATKRTRFSVIFDPLADKIALAAIIAAVFAYGLVPWPVALYVLLYNVAISVLAFRTYDYKGKIGATIAGKLTMFFQTTTILLFIASGLAPTGPGVALAVFAYANLITSIPLALVTFWTYRRLLKRSRSRHSTTIEM